MGELEKVLLAICSKVPQKELIEVTKMIALPWVTSLPKGVQPNATGNWYRYDLVGNVVAGPFPYNRHAYADERLIEQGYKLL